ncbi:MAG: hypothetical protein ACO2ON_04140 [Candidatus Nanopusillus sp.]
MTKLYKEYRMSELIKSEIEKYGLSIRPNSFLDIFLRTSEKSNEMDLPVYIFNRSLVKEVIECASTNEYDKINYSQLLGCIDKYGSELPISIKDHIRLGILITLHRIPSERRLSLDKIIESRTEQVPTGYLSRQPLAVTIIEDDDLDKSRALLPTVIHELIHSMELNGLYVEPRVETQIDIYDIIDNYIRPHNPFYSIYRGRELSKRETITELAMIRTLEDADIGYVSLNRKVLIRIKLHRIGKIKNEMGIQYIIRESHLLSYLAAYDMHELARTDKNMKEILKIINEIIDEELKLYIERELKKISSK